MRKVMKKSIVECAYRLGDGTDMEIRLIADGKICKKDDTTYEIFSQEARSGMGQKAVVGDYFKVDEKGFPYPNEKEWFEARYEHVDGCRYEKKKEILYVWERKDGMCDEIQFLIEHKGLIINENSENHYFQAKLWGVPLSQNRDAVIVFYHIEKDDNEQILDIDFNFVEREQFEKTYTYIE